MSTLRRICTGLSVLGFVVYSVVASASPVTLSAQFDPSAGPNQYVVQFPIELGGETIFMPINGGTFVMETDSELGTARLLDWHQDIEPISIFGMSTGPITITIDPNVPAEGSYNAEEGNFEITAAFIVEFDDSQLQEIGFFSPMVLDATEKGNIYGTGSIGSVHMYLEGGGQVSGAEFAYTCQTTATFDYLLDEDQAQPGDVNHDQNLDVSDAVGMLSFLFGGGAVACNNAVEVNGDGEENVADAIFLLNFLFAGGPATPAEPVSCTKE